MLRPPYHNKLVLKLMWFWEISKKSTTKFEIQQFDGHINFGMWKVHMMIVLKEQGLRVALSSKEKKPDTIKDSEWLDIDKKLLPLCSYASEKMYCKRPFQRKQQQHWGPS